MNDFDLAYIAGFFDGEGSVTIHDNYAKSPRGKSPNHTLQVSIGNTDPRILIWLHQEYGGSLCYRKEKRKNHRKVLQWTLRTRGALVFLEAIRPFLRMKCDQIDIAIAYQKTKKMTRKQLTPETIAWREAQRIIIRELNAKEWIN